MGLLSFLMPRRSSRDDTSGPERVIEHEQAPALIYAIGDIHGCYDKLVELETAIFEDVSKRGGEATLMILGDIVDRGPDSRGVIDRLMAVPPSGIRRWVLSGNHEAMMAGFLRNPRSDSDWLEFGGVETLMSFGLDASRWRKDRVRSKLITYKIEAYLSSEQVRFISERPYLVRFGNLVFVHAGIDRDRPPAQQTEREYLWMRPDPKKDAELAARSVTEADHCVVHGHTPAEQVYVSPFRINLDTGAYAGGPLSAARFVNGQFDGLLASRA